MEKVSLPSKEILHQSQQFRAIIAELKRESSYYPSVLIKYYEKFERSEDKAIDKVCYASTLVRINRDGKWYVVHCVESIVPNEHCDEKHLLFKMMDSVYKIQLLYHIVTMEGIEPLHDVDNLQQSEVERLTLLCG